MEYKENEEVKISLERYNKLEADSRRIKRLNGEIDRCSHITYYNKKGEKTTSPSIICGSNDVMRKITIDKEQVQELLGIYESEKTKVIWRDEPDFNYNDLTPLKKKEYIREILSKLNIDCEEEILKVDNRTISTIFSITIGEE